MNVMVFYTLCAAAGFAFVATVFMAFYYDVGMLIKEMRFARDNEIGTVKDKKLVNVENFGTALFNGADTSMLMDIEEPEEIEKKPIKKEDGNCANETKISIHYNKQDETVVSTKLVSLKATGGTKYLTAILDDNEQPSESIILTRTKRGVERESITDRIVSILKSNESRMSRVGTIKKEVPTEKPIKLLPEKEKSFQEFRSDKQKPSKKTEQLFRVFQAYEVAENSDGCERKDDAQDSLPCPIDKSGNLEETLENCPSRSGTEKIDISPEYDGNWTQRLEAESGPLDAEADSKFETESKNLFTQILVSSETESDQSGTQVLDHGIQTTGTEILEETDEDFSDTQILFEELKADRAETQDDEMIKGGDGIIDFEIDLTLDEDSREILMDDDFSKFLDFEPMIAEIVNETAGTEVLDCECNSGYTQVLDVEDNESGGTEVLYFQSEKGGKEILQYHDLKKGDTEILECERDTEIERF